MWEPSFDAKDECNKHFLSNDNNQSFRNIEKDCENYLRLILKEQSSLDENDEQRVETLLVCGTNANKPLCTRRNKSYPLNILETFDGIGRVPGSPHTSYNYLSIPNGDLYFATSIDYSEQGMRTDYFIDRSSGPSIQLRTSQYNSNWLNGLKNFNYCEKKNLLFSILGLLKRYLWQTDMHRFIWKN